MASASESITASTTHVRGPRPTRSEIAREVVDVLGAVPLFATAPLLRRWHLRWGATSAEVARAMPGDALVPGCQFRCTRAITIDAPPDAVWPWLVQVGFGRAGFYSYDLLDNAGHPSAVAIVPALQALRVGDWVPMFSTVNETTAFRVAGFEAEHHLLWLKPDSTWVWELTPDRGATRLVTRLRIRYDWSRPAGALLSVVLSEFGDFPMMRRMLKGIKRRAESVQARS